MKNLTTKFIAAFVIAAFGCVAAAEAQRSTGTISADTIAVVGMDLNAAAELFKEAASPEEFEQTINNSDTGINNFDLNEDGAVDFVRVTETSADQTRLIVLQAALGEDDFQDVATIAVEQDGGNYNLQLQGDPEIYGDDFYVVPAENNFSGWKVVRWLFRPDYRPYVSPFNFKNRPRWWGVRRPLAASAYRTRVGKFAGRRNFAAAKTVRVKSVAKLNYRPRASASVRKAKVTRTTTNPRNGNQTTTIEKTKTRESKPRKRKN